MALICMLSFGVNMKIKFSVNLFVSVLLLVLVGSVLASGQGRRIAVPQINEGKTDYVNPDVLVVVLMGDPQLFMTPETAGHVGRTMTDLETVPHDFVAVLGDLVQNNAGLYKDYRRLVLAAATKPVFSVPGNGDLGADRTLKAYTKATGLPRFYVIYSRGIRFFFLATIRMSGKSKHICDLGQEQLTWFSRELDKDTRSTTVVFAHPPLYETTWHSEDRRDRPFPGSMYLGESGKVNELLREHPNVQLFAHGHLHHKFGVKDEYGRGTYHESEGVMYVSVPASANGQGSIVLTIGKDEVSLRARDHGNNKWASRFDRTIKTATTIKTE